MIGRRSQSSVWGPRGNFGGLGRVGRDATSGTEMVYSTALQKQPPLRVKGVVGSAAMVVCFGFVGVIINFYGVDGAWTCNSKNEAFLDVWSLAGNFKKHCCCGVITLGSSGRGHIGI